MRHIGLTELWIIRSLICLIPVVIVTVAVILVLVIRASHKRCQYCGESIRKEAVVCRYCGNQCSAPAATGTTANPPAGGSGESSG